LLFIVISAFDKDNPRAVFSSMKLSPAHEFILHFFTRVDKESDKLKLFLKLVRDEKIKKNMKSIIAEICCKICWKGDVALFKAVTDEFSLTAQDISSKKGK
jgi:hypothetical protein